MWKHEIIDSLIQVKSRATAELLNKTHALLSILPQAVEFHLGNVDAQMPIIRKISQGGVSTIAPFSTQDGSNPPYKAVLLTFWVASGDGDKSKWAILLYTTPDDAIVATTLNLDLEYFLWCPSLVSMLICDGVAKIYSSVPSGQSPDDPHDNDITESARTTSTAFWIALHYLRLLNAKNIHHQQHLPSKSLNRKRLRRGDTPAERYCTLVVSTPGSKVCIDHATGQYRGVQAFHFCRGHFRDVSEDRPLFGRLGCHGRFWIPAHARGKKENGVIHKDYAVQLAGAVTL